MRYLAVFKGKEGVPPTTETMAAMGDLIEEMTDKGVLLSTEGCLPSVHGARVRRAGSKITVTDGPFTEAKEVIGGFAIMQVKTRDEMVQWTRRFMAIAGDGECEIRQVYEPGDFGPDAAQA